MNPVRSPVELSRSYLLLNHGPVVLVSSAHGERRNVMAAAWVMPLDFDPPKVAVVIDARSFTRELIDASGSFALSIPCQDLAAKVLAAGSVSGRDADKFSATGLATFAASKVAAPLIDGCVAWLECRVIPEASSQSRYDLFVAEVIAAWSDPQVFSGNRWHFPAPAKRTLHYQAGGAFFATGEDIVVEDGAS